MDTEKSIWYDSASIHVYVINSVYRKFAVSRTLKSKSREGEFGSEKKAKVAP